MKSSTRFAVLLAIFIVWADHGRLVAQGKAATVEMPQGANSKPGAGSLPQIPVSLFQRLTYNSPEAEALQITPQLKQEISSLLLRYHEQRRPWELLKSNLEHAKLTNVRFQTTIGIALGKLESEATAKAQTLLTPEQRAKLRQIRRFDIFQQTAVGLIANPVFQAQSVAPLDQYLANDDLLSILIHPPLQQLLLITDDQWLQIEAARKAADPEATRVMQDAVQLLTVQPPSAHRGAQRRQEQLMRQSLELLTDEQRVLYDQFMKDRREKLSRAVEAGDFPRQLKLAQTHGTQVQLFATTGDATPQTKVTLHNLFAEPEVVGILNLTPDQQLNFSRLIMECQTDIERLISDQKQELAKQTAERHQQLRDLILPHNRTFQTQLNHLLTQEQREILAKERRRTLGLAGLLDREISEILKLTEQQKTAIRDELQKPGPSMKLSAPGAGFDEFKKNSDEWHKKSREHLDLMTSNVWKQLTPEQVHQFEKIIGQNRPKAPVTSP